MDICLFGGNLSILFSSWNGEHLQSDTSAERDLFCKYALANHRPLKDNQISQLQSSRSTLPFLRVSSAHSKYEF